MTLWLVKKKKKKNKFIVHMKKSKIVM